MRWHEIVESTEPYKDLVETSTAGGTAAGNVATSVGGLGAGFDPDADWGIYQSARTKDKKKPVVLKR